jgi:hypothetical protein
MGLSSLLLTVVVACVLASASAVLFPKAAAGSKLTDLELRGLNVSNFRRINVVGQFNGK